MSGLPGWDEEGKGLVVGGVDGSKYTHVFLLVTLSLTRGRRKSCTFSEG